MLNTLFENPALFMLWVMAVVYAITVHEFMHVAMARLFGDDTGERLGRLSLNPLVHLNPIGMVLLVVAGFGWGNPAPFNPSNFRRISNPQLGSALVALAGPLANAASALLAIGLLKIFASGLASGNLLVEFLGLLLVINVMLMVFNLIPIPPLDGSKIVFGVLPNTPAWQARQQHWEQQGPWLLLFLIMLDAFGNVGIFHYLFRWAFSLVERLA